MCKTLRAGAVMMVILSAGPLYGQAPAPAETPRLEELDALKIGKLQAELAALQATYDLVQAQQEQRRALSREKAAALKAITKEAADKAQVNLVDGWRPDVERRVWHKP